MEKTGDLSAEAKKLRHVAKLLERDGLTPELRRIIDRELLHTPGSGEAGLLAKAFTVSVRQNGDEESRHNLRAALQVLGAIMRLPRSDAGARPVELARRLRSVAASFLSPPRPPARRLRSVAASFLSPPRPPARHAQKGRRSTASITVSDPLFAANFYALRFLDRLYDVAGALQSKDLGRITLAMTKLDPRFYEFVCEHGAMSDEVERLFARAAGSPVTVCRHEAASAHQAAFLLAHHVMAVAKEIVRLPVPLEASKAERARYFFEASTNRLAADLSFLDPNQLFSILPKLCAEFSAAMALRSEENPRRIASVATKTDAEPDSRGNGDAETAKARNGQAAEANKADTEPRACVSTTANDARDEWIYQQCVALVNYGKVIYELTKKEKWERITSISGIKAAANRYAKRHGLAPIPNRQPGRPSA